MKKTKKIRFALMLGALGIVFGDIGTSPLYALPAIFNLAGQRMPVSAENVMGIISLVIWSITMIVTVKYIGFIMRADNEGEGGIMALTALIKSSTLNKKYSSFFVVLGLVGVALFYGDSAITPAISVLSAIEGLELIHHDLEHVVLPATLIILSGLFWLQRYGTRLIGKLFGPVMLIWFATIAAGGLWQIWQHPNILQALLPTHAISFFLAHPAVAFLTMGAIILTVTGVEALYADMGHFGRMPIARTWLRIVYPALLICYMGQGALLIDKASNISNPLYLLYPESMRLTIVILATLATLIASQAVISGAFSLTRQAVQLGFLPKMVIRHTSAKKAGQVYVPFVNVSLFVVVSLLVLIFGSSQNLAGAYGMAVSITLAIDTILFLVVARILWHKSKMYAALLIASFFVLDLLFVSSSLSKLWHGGWFPLLLAACILVIIFTWVRGQNIISKKRQALEGPLQDFIDDIHNAQPPIRRVPGHAIYISHHDNLAPLALRATVDKLHELHEKVVVLTVTITNASHIPEDKRFSFDNLDYKDGISYVHVQYGFHDSPNIPKTLEDLRKLDHELDLDLDRAVYFISHSKIVPTKRRTMMSWQKALYCAMARNALSSSDYYKLPTDRTVEIRSLIEL